jgi:hypothetical protein
MNFKIYSRALIKNVGVIDWYSNQGIIFCQAKFLTFNVYWTVSFTYKNLGFLDLFKTHGSAGSSTHSKIQILWNSSSAGSVGLKIIVPKILLKIKF